AAAEGTAPAARRGRKPGVKVETAAAGTAAAPGYLLAGDPEGTRYYDIAAQNTVYKQLPGLPDCTLPGAMIVTGAAFAEAQAKYAALVATPNVTTAAAAAAPAATPATTQAATPASTQQAAASQPATSVTMQTVTAKLMELHKRDGNPGILPILQAFGVTGVPALASKDLVAVDAAVQAALTPAPNLFG
ncbi:MAG: hypothetical protein K2X64_04365, partial [Rhodocyclaceae bacterium]|nr:hypothetical protein [Rhodocyclaceae bacterium]